ncbi:hypothetical protein [uncultured Bdellovibrio sp.]|uniref:hypothetical protein n=1 Tax=Bdellovibrio sp. HCB-162 TaxID=3394234 RepID=UPI0025D1BAF7|nr:hypothetical protein [uncultured Bdellovibrio sp.]
MTFAKIITATIITIAATTSFGATKCDHKESGGLFAKTAAPSSVKVQTVKTASAPSTYTGTR